MIEFNFVVLSPHILEHNYKDLRIIIINIIEEYNIIE